ncbi:MAG: serine/threonine-protein kinase, partial [Pseudomonadota bacterium]
MATYGQYQVVERIAIGGMAEIYRGVAHGVEGFKRPVVIKKVHPRFSADDRFIKMLIKEAKITARLNHANIVQILDLGKNDEGEYFLVMEYVDGWDLRAAMDRAAQRNTRLSLDTILYIMPEVCDAVAYAHNLTDDRGRPINLIHRDISPSNILISYSGEVKLTDFGVARFGRDESVVGSLKGKLAYMSPEQARTELLDHRSDIFSLGAVLFEVVLGRKIFLGQTDIEMLKAVREAEIPSPSSIDPRISPQLEQIILKAVAPKPKDRYQSAELFSADLRTFRFENCSSRVSSAELAILLSSLFGKPVPKEETAETDINFTINTVAAFLSTQDSEIDMAPLSDETTTPGKPPSALVKKIRRGVPTEEVEEELSLDSPASRISISSNAFLESISMDLIPVGSVLSDANSPGSPDTSGMANSGVVAVQNLLDSIADPSNQKQETDFSENEPLKALSTDPERPADRLGVRDAFESLGPILERRIGITDKKPIDDALEEDEDEIPTKLQQRIVPGSPDLPDMSAPYLDEARGKKVLRSDALKTELDVQTIHKGVSAPLRKPTFQKSEEQAALPASIPVPQLPEDAVPQPLSVSSLRKVALLPFGIVSNEPRKSRKVYFGLLAGVIGLFVVGTGLLLIFPSNEEDSVENIPAKTSVSFATKKLSVKTKSMRELELSVDKKETSVDTKKSKSPTQKQTPAVARKPVPTQELTKKTTPKTEKTIPKIDRATRPQKKIRITIPQPKESDKPEVSAMGKLVIKSEPWAKIYINDRSINRTTSSQAFSVKAGTLEIQLRNPAL